MVLVRVPEGKDGATVASNLEQAGLLVKAETLMTSDDKISYPILRLSSLDPTTRALSEEDLFIIGLTLGEFLKSDMKTSAINSVSKIVSEMVESLPLFSEDWLPEEEILHERDAELMMKSMIYGM